MDLLTPSINVPAERAKLRALRDEIARDVAHREAIQRKYSPRGFPLLPDMHPLEAKAKPRHGEDEIRAMRSGSAMGIPSSAANLRQAQAGCCGCGGCANRVEREGVNPEGGKA